MLKSWRTSTREHTRAANVHVHAHAHAHAHARAHAHTRTHTYAHQRVHTHADTLFVALKHAVTGRTQARETHAPADSVAGSFTIDEHREMGLGDLQDALTCGKKTNLMHKMALHQGQPQDRLVRVP